MTDVLAAVLLLSGGLICLLGAIGVLRFPDLLSRLQATTKPQTFGLLLVLAGTALRLPVEAAAGLGLVALFQVMTTPVFAQLAGRAAHRTGNVEKGVLRTDELRERR